MTRRASPSTIAFAAFALLALSALAGCLSPGSTPHEGVSGRDDLAVEHTSPNAGLALRVDNASELYGDGAEVTFRFDYLRGDPGPYGSPATRFRIGFGVLSIAGNGSARIQGQSTWVAEIEPGSSETVRATVVAEGSGIWRVQAFAESPPPADLADRPSDGWRALNPQDEVFLRGDGTEAAATEDISRRKYRGRLPSYETDFERLGSGPVAVNETATVELSVNASHPAPRTVLLADLSRNLELVEGRRGQIVDLPSGESSFAWTVRVVDDRHEEGWVDLTWVLDCRVKCDNLPHRADFQVVS